MNYEESLKILEEIKKANKILINCHRSPDPDSVASAISMQLLLQDLGKKDVTIISPDAIPNNCQFLPNTKLIKKVNFDEYNFSDSDLFLIVDSGNWKQVTGEKNILASGLKKIVIDHHYTNPKYGEINIIDPDAGSTNMVIYKLIKDWKVNMSSDLAESLLTGIIGDTISFQTDVVGKNIFLAAEDLIESGADRNKVLFNLYKSRSIDEIHLMGEMLAGTQVDSQNKFAWIAIPKEISKKFPKSHDAKSFIASIFIQSVEGTDFGFVLEEVDDFSSVSFRTRTSFDVSRIAEELGGGGHKSAAAARIYLPFDQAVEKVLGVARKYATPPHQN